MLSSLSFLFILILTHSAFMSLLFPFKLGKWQLKWQIRTDVTQASFAPDKQEYGMKICISTREAFKFKFEAGHMAIIKVNTVAFIHPNFHHKKNKNSKIHNNNKNAMKLNVIEF